MPDDLYADRLEAAMREKGTAVCVGLDPRANLLPEEFGFASRGAVALGDWAEAVIEVVAPHCAAVKPNIAYYEAHGTAGFAAYERTVAAAKKRGVLVVLDAKRGDIGFSAEAYARGHLDLIGADAITIHGYLGRDSLEPFVSRCRDEGKGMYVLVRTSNPGARDLQDQPVGDGTVFDSVASFVDSIASEPGLVGASGVSSIGAVVGATYPTELANLRKQMSTSTLLVPGYGAQGGGASDCAGGFRSDGGGAIISSSRGITFAFHKGDHAERFGVARWRESVEFAVREMQSALEEVRTPTDQGPA